MCALDTDGAPSGISYKVIKGHNQATVKSNATQKVDIHKGLELALRF